MTKGTQLVPGGLTLVAHTWGSACTLQIGGILPFFIQGPSCLLLAHPWMCHTGEEDPFERHRDPTGGRWQIPHIDVQFRPAHNA